MCMCLVTQSCSTLYDPMDCSSLALLSMGFSRQEYWSGLPCLPPGGLPDPEIKPVSPSAPAPQAALYCRATGKVPKFP